MIPQNKLDQMDPRLVPLALAFDARMEEEGVLYQMGEVLRTKATQIAYFAQGREVLEEVNRLRKIAGLGPLPPKENLYTITKTLNSRHFTNAAGKSEAFDIVILKEGGVRTWDTKFDRDNDSIPDYQEAARIGQEVGLEPGAFWSSFHDWPHYQLNKGGQK